MLPRHPAGLALFCQIFSVVTKVMTRICQRMSAPKILAMTLVPAPSLLLSTNTRRSPRNRRSESLRSRVAANRLMLLSNKQDLVSKKMVTLLLISMLLALALSMSQHAWIHQTPAALPSRDSPGRPYQSYCRKTFLWIHRLLLLSHCQRPILGPRVLRHFVVLAHFLTA